MKIETTPCILPCLADSAEDFIAHPADDTVATVARYPGTILVLGAGGKMGLHLSMMLSRSRREAGSSDPVIAVSRFQSVSSRENFSIRDIPVIAGDLCDEGFLEKLPDAETVFFLAGAKFGTSSNPALLEQMNVRLPGLVAERFKRARIIAFSTGCVYPFVDVSGPGADESCLPAPNGPYAYSCLQREKNFCEGSARNGTPVALIRLNYSVEFRYGVLVDIAQKVFCGEPVDVTMGHVNVIWQGDALNQIIRCLGIADSPPVPINITGPGTLSVRSVATEFGVLFDLPVRFDGTESQTAWLSDASRSHQLFGEPETSVRQMMKWIAAWLRNGMPTLDKPTGFEKRDGKF